MMFHHNLNYFPAGKESFNGPIACHGVWVVKAPARADQGHNDQRQRDRWPQVTRS